MPTARISVCGWFIRTSKTHADFRQAEYSVPSSQKEGHAFRCVGILPITLGGNFKWLTRILRLTIVCAVGSTVLAISSDRL